MGLHLGDSLEKLKAIPDNSIDACVTDPPYGLAFMNKHWDYDVPSVELWREVFRVLKPGAHLLSFGGTRTYHRMAVNVEDAGFEVRDCILWHYGSGFPKSLDVSKAIDKAAGAEREVIGKSPNWRPAKTKGGAGFDKDVGEGSVEINLTAPATEAAKEWQGWGTALKPATEIIVLARKPLEKGLTVAENVQKWGCGAINVDASRIETGERPHRERRNDKALDGDIYGSGINGSRSLGTFTQGRWPANVLFDEEAAAMLDEQSGERKGFSGGGTKGAGYRSEYVNGEQKGKTLPAQYYNDSGGASRFFYVAKASKRERGPDNKHPCVKPLKLMEYLIKLVTPPKGTVLDPFMGSGSTGCAAVKLGFNFIGIEREAEYLEIAKRRIEHWSEA